MGVKQPKITATILSFFKKLDLGVKSVDGVAEPVYKLTFETEELGTEAMDNLFAIHRASATSEVFVNSTSFKGQLKKIDLGQRKVEGGFVPVYRISIEAPKLDADTITGLFNIHKKMKHDTTMSISWTDPQLALDFAPVVNESAQPEVDASTGEILNQPPLSKEDAIQFFDDEEKTG